MAIAGSQTRAICVTMSNGLIDDAYRARLSMPIFLIDNAISKMISLLNLGDKPCVNPDYSFGLAISLGP